MVRCKKSFAHSSRSIPKTLLGRFASLAKFESIWFVVVLQEASGRFMKLQEGSGTELRQRYVRTYLYQHQCTVLLCIASYKKTPAKLELLCVEAATSFG